MKIKDFVKSNRISIGSLVANTIAMVSLILALIFSAETLPIVYVSGGFVIGLNFCTICQDVIDLIAAWRNSK